jgi:formylglycine-generating enzyme required for sulfatase activity
VKQTLETLLQELQNTKTTDQRRLQIGEKLAKMGDPRPGVDVKDNLPDMMWLPVAQSGEVFITRLWRSDTPDEDDKAIPIGRFAVEPFYIAKFLVTYSQYQAFVEARDGFDNLDWWQGMPEVYQCQKLVEQRTKMPNYPRDTISWYQSVAFARWLNDKMQGYELPHPTGGGVLQVGDNAEIRLPAEWEWQWAAQNYAQAWSYPWGDKQTGFANTAESGLARATAVGMYPHGAAACGACDMAGNLMEWCVNDKVSLELTGVESTATKPLRGGDWGYGLENATCTYCDDEEPHNVDPLNGFRLILAETLGRK